MPVRRVLVALLALPVLAAVYLRAALCRGPAMRFTCALLALPVLAVVYVSASLHRGPATRLALALGIGGLVVVAAVGVPAGTIGAPTTTVAPLAASALGPAVATGRGLTAALIVDFDAPMEAASVAGAVRVDPAAPFHLSWSDDGMRLSVEPVGSWRPATFYTVTVGTSAEDREGRPLGTPLRAGFLTRGSTTARMAAVDQLDSGVALGSSIVLSFDRPVPVAGVLRALRVTPETAGQLLVASDGPDGHDPSVADSYVWEPLGLLASKTEYTIALSDALVDAEGAPVAVPAPLVFTTTKSPSVVRFRPRAGTDEIERSVPVSVRFTVPMDRRSTKKAFTVEVNGTRVDGAVHFAEDDTVLVFDPREHFPYGAKVVMRVAAGAVSAEGTPLDRARTATFTVEPKPKPAATPARSSSSGSGTAPPPAPAPRPASSSSLAAEKYLLTLMNRERTSRGVPALTYHAGVSDKVARPYAKKLVLANVCSHFYGGTVGDRLRAAGYTGYQWAENLGCRYFSDPRAAAESLVRFFLGSPGHFTNMVSPKYTHAGIGLWVASGRLRFVAVFYTP